MPFVSRRRSQDAVLVALSPSISAEIVLTTCRVLLPGLKYQADEENFDPRPASELCLPECLVDTWGGWVFINMDPNAEPLLDFLDPLPTRLAGFKLEEMRIA